MAAGADEVTIYVGHAGEKYSDPADWRELIVERRLAADSWLPVRRGGALQHLQAYDVPELRPLFDALAPPERAGAPTPATAPPPPAERRPPEAAPARPPSPPPPSPGPVVDLPKGANTAVQGASVLVHLSWTAPPAGVEVDGCAYLLSESGRVRSDADMVFYNQATAENEAVRLLSGGPAGTAFQVDLARLPAGVARVVFCAAGTSATAAALSLQALRPAIEAGSSPGRPSLRHDLDLDDGREAAVIFGELYRRGDGWRFRAVSQGFHGGLAPLARSYGVVVQE